MTLIKIKTKVPINIIRHSSFIISNYSYYFQYHYFTEYKKIRTKIDNETRALNIISSQDLKSRPVLTTKKLAVTHLIFPNHYSTITTHTPICIAICRNDYLGYK